MNDYEEHVEAVRQAAKVLMYVAERAIESIDSCSDIHSVNVYEFSRVQMFKDTVEELEHRVQKNGQEIGRLGTVYNQAVEILRGLNE